MLWFLDWVDTSAPGHAVALFIVSALKQLLIRQLNPTAAERQFIWEKAKTVSKIVFFCRSVMSGTQKERK